MYAFQQWMKRHGYIMKNPDVYDVGFMYGLERNEKRRLCRMFNESATIRKVSTRDAMKYVRKLHEEHGYVFHAITSLSNDEYAQHLRTRISRTLQFHCLREYVYLDTGAVKTKFYRDTGVCG